MILYLDTSVALRVLLREPGVLDAWDRWESVSSSELLRVEARRTLDRLRIVGSLRDDEVAELHDELAQIEEGIGFIDLDRRVLTRAAGPMPTVVKTLDAIHLASASLLAELSPDEVVFATHDHQQSLAARALGFRCVD